MINIYRRMAIMRTITFESKRASTFANIKSDQWKCYSWKHLDARRMRTIEVLRDKHLRDEQIALLWASERRYRMATSLNRRVLGAIRSLVRW